MQRGRARPVADGLTGMFVHVFAFIWNDAAQDHHRQAALAEIRAFQGAIPGLVSLHAGTNVSVKTPEYTTAGVMVFASRSAFAAYETHPLHRHLLAWLVPLIGAIEIDFEDAS